MRSSLATGIDTAKGLAVAWQIPLVGVNHMQAHALTPRLVSALNSPPKLWARPTFPFLSLLVSGGHTLLVHSTGLTDHQILASTSDIAIGDAIDKVARSVLPPDYVERSGEIMYGRLLEQFAFPNGEGDHAYVAPATRAKEMMRKMTPWGWGFGAPLAETRSGSKSKSMEFSFSGTESSAKRIVGNIDRDMSIGERRDIAKEAMRVVFEHLASRIIMALTELRSKQVSSDEGLTTLVVSGGVASNRYLKTM